MSGEVVAAKGAGVRVVQAAALVVVLGVLLLATQIAPPMAGGVVGTMAGLGVLLLAGTLTSELAELLGLPHLSGYLLAGVVVGPHVLELADLDTVSRLQPINTFTLALIALAGGAELRIATLRRTMRSLLWATGAQSAIVFLVSGVAFFALARLTPFSTYEIGALIGVAALWGIISVSRSPAALLGVFSQLRPSGPLTEFSLAFVMLSDVIVIVMATLAITLVRPLLDPGAALSVSSLMDLGHELLGSVSLGVTLGLLLAAYLRIVGRNLLLVLLVVGVGLSELLRYIQFDAMLSFLVAGFVVENGSSQGHKLLVGIERTGAIVFVIFFGLAGAQLDLPILVELWPVALGLCTIRSIATWSANRVGSHFAGDPPAIKRWGFAGLVSQSGLTLGLSLVIVRSFPGLSEAFHSLVIASCAINTLVGPIILKLGLDRAGESRAADEPEAAPSSAV